MARELDRHVLAVRAGIPRRGHDVRRLVRVPRRLGAAGAALARHRGDLSAAQRHRVPAGQDRRRRAEAPRERRSAAPRDAELRHGRPGHDRGAAHRPREAQRQGHGVGGEARRPAAPPDGPAPRGDHRAVHRDVREPLRRGARAGSPTRSTPRPRRSSSRSSRPTRGCAACRDAIRRRAGEPAGVGRDPRGRQPRGHPRASPTARSP